MLKNETEDLIVKEKNYTKKRHKKVNERKMKKEMKVKNDDIIEAKNSDMNQNFDVNVPVQNKFEIFDHITCLSTTFPSILVSKSPSTTKVSTVTISDDPSKMPLTHYQDHHEEHHKEHHQVKEQIEPFLNKRGI